MIITNAKFIDAANALVEAEIDGVTTQEVGNGDGDSRIRAWLAQGNKPARYVAPPEPAKPSRDERIESAFAALGFTIDDLKARLKK